jgi:amidophosphoribosyltransferase
MECISVYSARRRIGKHLAKQFPVPGADVVIPVPDSARPAALGYALELGIPFEEALLKDRYRRQGSMRSFIEPFQESRNEINKGILPIREVIDGKNVVVVDDSIVRGNSSKSIVRILRSAGARQINMIVTYPPIRFPCYAGIDFPSQEELLAFKYSRNESAVEAAASISKVVGADYVAYNTTTNLARAIGISKRELCFTCSSGDYSSLGITPIFKSRQEVKGED